MTDALHTLKLMYCDIVRAHRIAVYFVMAMIAIWDGRNMKFRAFFKCKEPEGKRHLRLGELAVGTRRRQLVPLELLAVMDITHTRGGP